MRPMKNNRVLSIVFCGVLSCILLFALWSYLGRTQIIPEPDIPNDHKFECISYTPLIGSETPWKLTETFHIPRERIESDFALLSKNFDCIRIYSMKGYEEVIDLAPKYGLKMILSAWIGGKDDENEAEIKALIAAAKRYQNSVKFVLVGNEVLLRHEQTETQMIELVKRVKKELPDIPVSYGEVLGFWKQYGRLADVVDFLTIHILPYWSDLPPRIDDIVNYVQWDASQISKLYPDKIFYVGEIGWPSQGRVRGLSEPSPVNEARFFRAIIPLMEKLGWHYNLIEAFDQPWKRGSEGCVGGYWGLYDVYRQGKNIFSGAVSNIPEWKILFGFSVALVILMMGFVLQIFPPPLGKRGQGEFETRSYLPLLTGIFFLASFSIVKQGHEFYMTVYNPLSRVEAVFYLVLAITGAFLLLFALISQTIPQQLSWLQVKSSLKEKKHYDAFSFLYEQVVIFFLIALSLGLVFAGRSTSMLGFGFFIPVLTLFSVSFLKRKNRQVLLQDAIAGVVLLLLFLGILINESVWNAQANLWMLVCVIGALSCLPIFSRKQLWEMVRILQQRRVIVAAVCVAAVCALALLIRAVLVESRYADLDGICSADSSLWYCQLKAWIGISIGLKLWGYAALVLFLCAVLFKKSGLAFVAILCALTGLVWYQPFPAAYVCAFAVIYLVEHSSCPNASALLE